MNKQGSWYGNDRYFGLHYDLHAGPKDTELGTGADPAELARMFQLMKVDWVQTDCKGHAGYTSWFSRTPEATVATQLKVDALERWRKATRRLGLPLHCHYSGIWDSSAGRKHPEWAVVDKEGKAAGAPFGGDAGKNTPDIMCPRGDYPGKLMIPQMLELIDRYGVDGFWVDGEFWAVKPCYCDKCREAFTEQTGIAEPPKETTDATWPAWIEFIRDSFYEYAARYCDAVHAHRPGVKVCSNWIQTFKNPGEPVVPTDWISGDNGWIWGMDSSRCEARFISTRGKPWDIMLWSFYCQHGMGDATSPWVFKPVQMLQQEAAVTLALGGAIQIYENPGELRNGQLIPWRARKIGQVGSFVKARRRLCQDTETIGQIAVLHSEHHLLRHTGMNLMWNADVAPVQGAVFSLLENHYNVDILDEWALLGRLGEFPAVVAPEQSDMSAEIAEALKRYVQGGGKLLVTGAKSLERFGEEFLGVGGGKVAEKAKHHVPVGDGSVPIYSEQWRLVEPETAEAFGELGTTPLLEQRLVDIPAWTLHKVGKGAVAYVPCDVMRYFDRNRYPRVREFVGHVARRLIGSLPIRVTAPTCVDVVLRRKGGRRVVHLINRSSGLPNTPSAGAIDEIMPVGPIRVEMKLAGKPKRVYLAFEKGRIASKFSAGILRVELDKVKIHAGVVVEM